MEVRHLTKVDFYKLGHGGLRAFAECMSSFAGIRSLTLRDKHRAILPEITERLTILTQLTELYLDPISRSYSLRLPTGIVDLHLGYTMSLVGASLNANEYLICLASLTNLTSLSIKSSDELRLFHPNCATPSQFSRQLSGLKDLETRNVRVDDLFVDALADMTGLTKLCLVNRLSVVDPYTVCPRLSLLSNLEVLKISCIESRFNSRVGLPQMRLPKLRELNLPLANTDLSARREVWQMFPCLREFSLSGRRTSAYE